MSAVTSPTKPFVAPVNVDAIPAELRQLPQWVWWAYTPEVDPESGETDWDKPPLNCRTGAHAKSTDPQTWSTFEGALATYCERGWDGVGIVLYRDAAEEKP